MKNETQGGNIVPGTATQYGPFIETKWERLPNRVRLNPADRRLARPRVDHHNQTNQPGYGDLAL